MEKLKENSIQLLQLLISTPSFSMEENDTASILERYFNENGIQTNRLKNNVWVKNKYFDSSKKTILLNSHHDTVKPNQQYTRNPFNSKIENKRLYGLGSNDAGGSLVSLIACFLFFYEKQDLNFNLLLAATAEEEISGKNGVELILPHLGEIYFGIIGEPTNMKIAIAEKGLLVIDCISRGKAGHAARDEGENAIYKALKDIEWFKSFHFPLISEWLGKVKMNVTQINGGIQHNVTPDNCQFTVDIRTTEIYNNQEVIRIIKENVNCELRPRSMRLNSSFVSVSHPFVLAGKFIGLKLFASPTLSDQALMTEFPTFKLGPGLSSRSHTADEFILIEEIYNGIEIYIKLIQKINKTN